MQPNDLIYPLKLAQIPVVVIVDEEDKDLARDFLKSAEGELHFASPAEAPATVESLLA
jgi:hypothetical protein